MIRACPPVALAVILVLSPVAVGAADGFLRIAGTTGTVIVDGDTIEPWRTLIHLAPGPHAITHLPRQDEIRWKPPLVELPFQLSGGETLEVDLESTITVRIESEPPGCEVQRSGNHMGTTPLVLSTLAGFPDTLTLVRSGYLPAVISPSGLTEGSIFRVLLIPEHVPSRDGGTNGKGSAATRDAVLKYSSLAASVALVSLGFWYKDKADSYYDDYLSHGNPETLESLYRKSVEMDDRARVFWIAGEAGTIITSYLFLRDFFRERSRKERLDEMP